MILDEIVLNILKVDLSYFIFTIEKLVYLFKSLHSNFRKIKIISNKKIFGGLNENSSDLCKIFK
jgi:hypothetical protein